ncbi:MAG: hypothetical protein WBC37_09760 [Burkholderiaceae bacterium]
MTETITLRQLLGDIPKEKVDEALELHSREGAGDSVIASVRGLLAEAGAARLNEALDVDALGLLGQAWVKLQTLRQYRDTKKYPPGTTSVVQLGQHDVTYACDPLMELRKAGIALPALRLTLELDARLKSVALSVRDGRVVAAAPGDASAIARLKYKKTTLKEQATPAWKLPGSIGFGDGIEIPG